MQEEACRTESPLNKQRIHSRNSFVEVLAKQMSVFNNKNDNKLNLLSVYWVLENASFYLLTETKCAEEDVKNCKLEVCQVISSIVTLS